MLQSDYYFDAMCLFPYKKFSGNYLPKIKDSRKPNQCLWPRPRLSSLHTLKGALLDNDEFSADTFF